MDLPPLLDPIRRCPLGCDWQANRRLIPAQWTYLEDQVAGFIERCQQDLAAHLIVAHGARVTSHFNTSAAEFAADAGGMGGPRVAPGTTSRRAT